MLGIGGCVAVCTYLYFAATLPPMPDLARYQAEVATTTVVRGWDGTPLAEFATERREILPFERIPHRLIEAFLAAEDRRFYEHGGIDYRGMRVPSAPPARGEGRRELHIPSGGQVLCVRSGPTSARSARRFMAHQVEKHLSKNDI